MNFLFHDIIILIILITILVIGGLGYYIIGRCINPKRKKPRSKREVKE